MRVSKKGSENVFEEMNRRIDEIYGRRDLALYRQLISSSSQSLDAEIAEFCRAREIQITDRNLDSDFSEKPYCEWRFDFPPFQKPGSYIEYATTLQISKLCRLFFLRNSFKMRDMNPDATNDFLEGEGHAREPITYAQKDLYDKIVGRLASGSYRLLNKRERRRRRRGSCVLPEKPVIRTAVSDPRDLLRRFLSLRIRRIGLPGLLLRTAQIAFEQNGARYGRKQRNPRSGA